MNNEIKINVPEGMEIDKENSTFECIKFKPKWVPKRGDIAVAGYGDATQIVLIAEYVEPSDTIGFNIKPLALLSPCSFSIYDNNRTYKSTLWVKQAASTSEKEQLIKELDKEGYVYDPNDPRVIYKKEKEVPKTWIEFCKDNPLRMDESYISDFSRIRNVENVLPIRNPFDDANVLPSREYAEAMLALCKLIQLRDCYNGDWKANWLNGDENKYTIIYYAGEVLKGKKYFESALLNFKTENLRDTFYINFRDLIEQAKLLL